MSPKRRPDNGQQDVVVGDEESHTYKRIKYSEFPGYDFNLGESSCDEIEPGVEWKPTARAKRRLKEVSPPAVPPRPPVMEDRDEPNGSNVHRLLELAMEQEAEEEDDMNELRKPDLGLASDTSECVLCDPFDLPKDIIASVNSVESHYLKLVKENKHPVAVATITHYAYMYFVYNELVKKNYENPPLIHRRDALHHIMEHDGRNHNWALKFQLTREAKVLRDNELAIRDDGLLVMNSSVSRALSAKRAAISKLK